MVSARALRVTRADLISAVLHFSLSSSSPSLSVSSFRNSLAVVRTQQPSRPRLSRARRHLPRTHRPAPPRHCRHQPQPTRRRISRHVSSNTAKRPPTRPPTLVRSAFHFCHRQSTISTRPSLAATRPMLVLPSSSVRSWMCIGSHRACKVLGGRVMAGYAGGAGSSVMIAEGSLICKLSRSRTLLSGKAECGRTLEHPNVPATLPDTLGNIVGLTSFKMLGNHSVPSEQFGTAVVDRRQDVADSVRWRDT